MPSTDPPHRPEPFEHDFPTLPIVVTPDPKRPGAERYGGLYYLGIAGLVVLCGLLAWFGWGVWSLRSVWANVYVLNDPRRAEGDRVAAAYARWRGTRP